MNYWLMKSEPEECSIDDLAKRPKQIIPWFGVRNYQARNFMRDAMHLGDEILFYHSSCPQPGIAGLATVSSAAYPDATQFDQDSKYYDPKATLEKPRWLHVDVQFKSKTRLISLSELRETEALETMIILKPGNRLSITPVTSAEWKAIGRLIKSSK